MEVDLSIFGNPGRTSAENERDLSKSWPSGSTESGTSDLWQSRQSRSAEAELHIFGSPGRDGMRKWPYPIWKSWQNKCGNERDLSKFWPSGSTENRTSDLWQSRQSRRAEAELHIFGSPGRDEMRKWTYPYMEVLAEQVRKMNEIFRSPGRAEDRKRNFRSLAVKAEQKCRSGTSHLLKSQQR